MGRPRADRRFSERVGKLRLRRSMEKGSFFPFLTACQATGYVKIGGGRDTAEAILPFALVTRRSKMIRQETSQGTHPCNLSSLISKTSSLPTSTA